jgi:hypothetical protein
MCQRRRESPFSLLSDDCIYYILNMMRWDWINDTIANMVREQKNARRMRRRLMIADMQATLVGGEDRMAEGVVAPANAIPDDDAVLGVDEDGGYGDDDQDNDDDDDDDDMDEDSAHGSDADAASLDSAVSDEYAWGDHVSSRNAFVYNDDESLSDESGEGDDAGAGAGAMERRRQNGMLRARRSILSFLRSH